MKNQNSNDLENADTHLALLFGYDNCISANNAQESIATHRKLLDSIKARGIADKSVGNFSNRHNMGIDIYGSTEYTKDYYTGSCFVALEEFAKYLNASLNKLLLSDIFIDSPNTLTMGQSWEQIQQARAQHALFQGAEFLPSIPDLSRFSQLYAHMHYLSYRHTNKKVLIECYEHSEETLIALSKFLKKYHTFVPESVTITFFMYNPNQLKKVAQVSGTGKVDYHLRQTIIDMTEIVITQEMEQNQKLNKLNYILYITPDRLKAQKRTYDEKPRIGVYKSPLISNLLASRSTRQKTILSPFQLPKDEFINKYLIQDNKPYFLENLTYQTLDFIKSTLYQAVANAKEDLACICINLMRDKYNFNTWMDLTNNNEPLIFTLINNEMPKTANLILSTNPELLSFTDKNGKSVQQYMDEYVAKPELQEIEKEGWVEIRDNCLQASDLSFFQREEDNTYVKWVPGKGNQPS